MTFHLQPDLHSATFGQIVVKGFKAEDRFRGFYEEKNQQGVPYKMSAADISWVLGILEENLLRHPNSATSDATSTDFLITTWQRIKSDCERS